MEFALYIRQKFGSIAVVRRNYEVDGELRFAYPPEFELTLDQIVAELKKPELFGRLEHIHNVNRNVHLWISRVGVSASEVAQALRQLE